MCACLCVCPYVRAAGHEVVGEVIATGSNVSTLKPGSRVGVGWIKNSCRRCAFCLKGEENICLKGYEGEQWI